MTQCAHTCTCNTLSVFLFVCVTSAETGNHAAQKSRQQELGEGEGRGLKIAGTAENTVTLSAAMLISLSPFLGPLRPS